MKNKILAMLLSFTLIFTTTGFSFAEDEVVDEQKSKPVQIEQVDKDKEVKQEVAKKEVVVKEEAKPEVKQEATKEDVAVSDDEVVLDKEPAEVKINDPPAKLDEKAKVKEDRAEKKPRKVHVRITGKNISVESGYQLKDSDVIIEYNDNNHGWTTTAPEDVDVHLVKHPTYTKSGPMGLNWGMFTFAPPNVVIHDPQLKDGYVTIVEPEPPVVEKQLLKFYYNDGLKRGVFDAEVAVDEEYTCVVPKLHPEGQHFVYWEDKDTGETYRAGEVIVGTEEPDVRYFEAIYEDDNDAVKKWPLKLIFNYEDVDHNRAQKIVDNLWVGETYNTAELIKDSTEGLEGWKLVSATCGDAPSNIPATYTFNGMTERPQRVWTYEAVYKPEPKPIPIEIHIEGNVDSRVYNGEEQTLGGFNVVTELPEGVDVKWGHLTMYAAKGTNVGKYYMTLSENKFILTGENAGKYEPTFILDKQGMLEITPKEIVITANDKSKMLGEQTPMFDETITGLDTQADRNWFEKHVTYTIACDYEEAVGDYPIVVAAEVVPEPIIIGPITPRPRPPVVDIERPHEYLEEAILEYAKEEVLCAKSVDEKKIPAEAVSEVVKPVVEVIEKPIAELKLFKKSNYSVKTVNGVFKIRDKVVPPVDPDTPDNPDNPVVGPTDNGDNTPGLGDNDSTVMKAKTSGVVKTGDKDACWALLNLLLMLTSCLIALVLVLTKFMRRRNGDEDSFFSGIWIESIMSAVVAAFTAVMFFITENMNNPMVWTDRWTIMMVVLFALQLVVVGYATYRDKVTADEE